MLIKGGFILTDWYIDESEESIEDYDYSIGEYDITSSPNDFNVITIYNFLESGVVKVPAFQRNYVWDQVRASKLIESLIIGLPIPQIFLYEEQRNKFLVIDGQQRLMTIYYFIKQRFPKKEKRSELGIIFDTHGHIPEEILMNNEYFKPFKLKLPKSKFDGLVYEELDEFKSSFELKTIRNIIIKQNFPQNEHNSVFEIFNRLNTGSLNLKPQEIRSSLYHSDFDTMLKRINLNENWRILLGVDNPDLRLKDVELLLRAIGIMAFGENYKAPMNKFLNYTAESLSKWSKEDVGYLYDLLCEFFEACSKIQREIFTTNYGKFNISIFESVFYATCNRMFKNREIHKIILDEQKLESLKTNSEFLSSIQTATANKDNVNKRLNKAEQILNE